MNIIEKIKELNFPKEHYVVIGSGTMDVLGIRKAQDIDISTSEELFEVLKNSGDWEEYEKYGRPFLKKDVFEINNQLNWDKYNTVLEEANKTALFIDDIPFLSLDELVKFKTASGREKDIQDIKLIKEFQQNN